MSDQGKDPESVEAKLRAEIQSLRKEMRVLQRQNNRSKTSPLTAMFGMPPLPAASMMTASGPMMMAWLIASLYSAPNSDPAVLEAMARFASNREDFWHVSSDLFALMADDETDTESSDGKDHSTVSPDDKKKIKALLESNFDQKTADAVIHGMNALDRLQRIRDRSYRRRGT